jgi:hypothetical protein
MTISLSIEPTKPTKFKSWQESKLSLEISSILFLKKDINKLLIDK